MLPQNVSSQPPTEIPIALNPIPSLTTFIPSEPIHTSTSPLTSSQLLTHTYRLSTFDTNLHFTFFNKENTLHDSPFVHPDQISPSVPEISKRIISDDFENFANPTTESRSMFCLFNLIEQLNQTEPITFKVIPSEKDLAIVVYEKHVPKTLDECISLFRTKDKKRISKLKEVASTNTEP